MATSAPESVGVIGASIPDGFDRSRLARFPSKCVSPPNASVTGLQPRQYLEAVVRAAVVDDDDLVGAAPRRHRPGHFLEERLERRRFVAHRNDDGEIDHRDMVIW